jgi:hypothetical protein
MVSLQFWTLRRYTLRLTTGATSVSADVTGMATAACTAHNSMSSCLLLLTSCWLFAHAAENTTHSLIPIRLPLLLLFLAALTALALQR